LNDEFRTMNAQNVSTEISTIAKEVLGELFWEKNEELYEFFANNPGPPMEEKPHGLVNEIVYMASCVFYVHCLFPELE
jgi:hypothetical protein